MTEQEKREKAIDDMDFIFYNECKAYLEGECPKGKNCRTCQNGILYDAGYRKEEEVRKKTMREIYKALLGTAHINGKVVKENYEIIISLWTLEDIDRLFKDLGMEVEE